MWCLCRLPIAVPRPSDYLLPPHPTSRSPSFPISLPLSLLPLPARLAVWREGRLSLSSDLPPLFLPPTPLVFSSHEWN
eukprot:scaffold83210_cov27-Tisochrysis_lutea.AAC.3